MYRQQVGCGETCGCEYITKNMKLMEPATALASHLEAGSLQMRDMLAYEHYLANFYLAESAAQKEEERQAQEDLARIFGVKT